MGRRSLAAVAASVLLTVTAVAWPSLRAPRVDPDVVASGSPLAASDAPATRPVQLSAGEAERAFLVALNRRRQTLDLQPLAVDPALTTMARGWANHMAASQKLAHNPDLVRQAPAGWYKLGENVGVGVTVADLHVAFLRSPEHYRNIVEPGFDRVGIGVVGQQYIIWVAVDFEQPAAVPKLR